jgi:hypothetical protein
MTWAEAQASLQLEAELRVGAVARLRAAVVEEQMGARSQAASAALRSVLDDR